MTCNVTWTQTTHERYWDMLGAVPPAYQGKGGFLVGEPHDYRMCEVDKRMSQTFRAFLEQGDARYWEADKPLTKAEFIASNRPSMTRLDQLTKEELWRMSSLALGSWTACDINWRTMHERLHELGLAVPEQQGDTTRYCLTHHGLKLLAEHLVKA